MKQRYVLRCRLCQLKFADAMTVEQVQAHFRVVHDQPGNVIHLELYDTKRDRVVGRT